MSDSAAELIGRLTGLVMLLDRDEAGPEHALAMVLAYRNVSALLTEALLEVCYGEGEPT